MAVEVEIKELKEEMGKTFHSFKEENDKRIQEIKTQGQELGLTKEKMLKLNDSLDRLEKSTNELQAKTVEPISKRLDELDIAMKRSQMGDSRGGPKENKAMDVFMKFCRKGENWMPIEERKALVVADNTQAGYLVPVDYAMEIIKQAVEMSPLRQFARIRQTGRTSLQVPKRTGTFSASWVADTGTKSETTGLTYGLEEIPTNEMYALVKISNAQLEDSAFNLEEELRMEFAEQFGVAEGLAFMTGTGKNQPEGIITNSSISTVVTGSASAVAAAGLINLWGALQTTYARNAIFMLNRTTLRDLRKLVDGNGQYLWQPGLAGALPNTILGDRYVEMPDLASPAANAKPIIYGDPKRGYNIVDRLDIAVQRDEVTSKLSGQVEFLARKRVGGQVVDASAFKIQICST